jgi:hypothetical protein
MIASGSMSETRRNLVRIRQIGPSGFGTFRELRGFFAVGGGVEVGGDDTAAEVGQPSHGGRTDQAEPAGDEHSSSHQPLLPADMTFSF